MVNSVKRFMSKASVGCGLGEARTMQPGNIAGPDTSVNTESAPGIPDLAGSPQQRVQGLPLRCSSGKGRQRGGEDRES